VLIGATDECWPWQRGKSSRGYGIFSVKHKSIRAHRFAYFLTHGPIPFGKIILHSCDNPPCCNPSHLTPGTNLENVQDRHSKGRDARGVGTGRAKLTDALVLAIRADVRGARPLAKELGVARSLVQRVRQRRLWSHV
jgi:hypothetical protein